MSSATPGNPGLPAYVPSSVRIHLDLPPVLVDVIERLAAERRRPVEAFLVDLVHAGVDALVQAPRSDAPTASPVDGPFVQLSDRDALCRVLVGRHEEDPDGAPPPPPSCPPLERR